MKHEATGESATTFTFIGNASASPQWMIEEITDAITVPLHAITTWEHAIARSRDPVAHPHGAMAVRSYAYARSA